jgi:hypothetical protein
MRVEGRGSSQRRQSRSHSRTVTQVCRSRARQKSLQRDDPSSAYVVGVSTIRVEAVEAHFFVFAFAKFRAPAHKLKFELGNLTSSFAGTTASSSKRIEVHKHESEKQAQRVRLVWHGRGIKREQPA